jgi:hypothetical protein
MHCGYPKLPIPAMCVVVITFPACQLSVPPDVGADIIRPPASARSPKTPVRQKRPFAKNARSPKTPVPPEMAAFAGG